MTVIFAILLAKLFDPVTAVLSILLGVVSRASWQIVLGAIGVAILVELLLFATQLSRSFMPVQFMIGFLAALFWAVLAYWIKQRRKRARTTTDKAAE